MSDSYSEAELRQCLGDLGVGRGDCMFIHTALKSIGKLTLESRENTLEALLRIFTDEVGKSGTIAVPTFNFAFCKGEKFDIDKTPCDGMGAFSEFVRTNPQARRARHPFHSVALIGKDAEAVTQAEGYSEFSEGSFFDALLKLDCKILFYGVNFVETFVHIAEERSRVPYRFWKTFTGSFIEGTTEKTITVNFYARRFDMDPVPRVDVAKIGRYLREVEVITSRKLGMGHVSICSGVAMVETLMRKFEKDPLFALMA